MIVLITRGASWKNNDVPEGAGRQFAHEYVADDPQGREPQAGRFMDYARALGDHISPFVLIPGPIPDDPAMAQKMKVDMDGWKSIVQSATGEPVEIR